MENVYLRRCNCSKYRAPCQSARFLHRTIAPRFFARDTQRIPRARLRRTELMPNGFAPANGKAAAACVWAWTSAAPAYAGVWEAQHEPIAAAGLAAAAVVEPESGFVRVGENLGWKGLPVGAILAHELGRPACIDGDAFCGALTEGAAGGARKKGAQRRTSRRCPRPLMRRLWHQPAPVVRRQRRACGDAPQWWADARNHKAVLR